MEPVTSLLLPTAEETRLRSASLSERERQRALGAMIGSAVGDALGAGFEFGPAGAYRQRFPIPVHGGLGEMIGGGTFGWAPGEFTDDTQMALTLARSLLDVGHYDPDRLWADWRAWAEVAPDVGVGTRNSLSFTDWRTVTVPDPERTAGNGALMRATPLALAYLDAPDEVARAVVLHQAALTHQHPAAGWGAWLAVAMMRAAIVGRDAFAALDQQLSEVPSEWAGPFAEVLAPTWVPGDPAPGNGSVWGCLAQAVWAVRHHDTFADAVTAAIDLGGDTDTVACVTGALAGGLHGVQTIPSRWVTYLNGSVTTVRGTDSVDLGGLSEYSLSLLGLSGQGEKPLDAPVGPVEVAERLHAANLLGAAATPTDWAVVSLCRTGSRFAGHPVRRQVYLIDDGGDHNPDLASITLDTVDAIDALLDEGRDVVVHCHAGQSRTSFIIKAWKMRRDGIDHAAANEWLEARWPHVRHHNGSFTAFLDEQWRQYW